MRLVVARCTVDYTGRLTARLPEATRVIMVKADGSVVKPAIDRVFPFGQAKEAYRYMESGSHFGKVVIDVTA